ncbi:hypothetical protein Tco_0059272 [Tanacetum coccineum]
MHTTSLQNTTNGSKPNPRSNNQISRSLLVSKSSCGMSNGVSLVDKSRNSSSFSDSKHFVCSTCHKCVFNANHDNCITKFLKEVNSRAKVQSPKTRNNNKPVEPKSHTQKPSRHIAIGQRFSLNKSSAVHEKPNTPRSCLRWIPTGRIFKLLGLRWIPTGKMFTDNTTKVNSEPSNGSNDVITNSYECDQTLNVSAVQASLFNDKITSVHISSGLALQQKNDVCSHQFRPRSSMTNDVCSHQPRSLKKRKVYASVRFIFKRREIFLFLTILINMIDAFSMLVLLSSGSTPRLEHQLLTPRTISSGLVPQPPSPTPNVPPTNNDWDSLFCPMFVEYFNPSQSVVQPVLVAVVQEPVVSTGTPSSTRIDQDTPSTSTSQTIKEAQSHVIPTSVEEDDHVIKVAYMDNDL